MRRDQMEPKEYKRRPDGALVKVYQVEEIVDERKLKEEKQQLEARLRAINELLGVK